MKESFLRQMEQELGQIGIHLEEKQMNQFYQYMEILVETNKVMNLTAITEEKEIITKHFVDSLSLIKVLTELKEEKTLRIIDVGTGGGFPGIPLKIAFPSCQITLLDSLQKRVKFLEEVCRQLGLRDIEAVHGRAEDMGQKADYRERYDCAVSRAVANLSTLSEYCLPFVKTGGVFISYKSGEVEEEAEAAKKAIQILGGKLEEVYPFLLPDTEMKRSFVKIRKIKETGKRYPRKAGMPAKEPLGGKSKS